MPTESATEIRWLSTTECWQRLEEHPTGVGRVGTGGAAPDIIPVNYAVDGRNVVFRMAIGARLAAIAGHERIVFEVDHTDAASRRAWSVVLRGFAEPITDADVLARLRKLPLRLWDPGSEAGYVRIATNMVEGREIR